MSGDPRAKPWAPSLTAGRHAEAMSASPLHPRAAWGGAGRALSQPAELGPSPFAMGTTTLRLEQGGDRARGIGQREVGSVRRAPGKGKAWRWVLPSENPAPGVFVRLVA